MSETTRSCNASRPAASSGVSTRAAAPRDPAGGVTSRADVYWVVTEFGAARLHGRTLRERAWSLVDVAHPDFRGELSAAAHARFGPRRA